MLDNGIGSVNLDVINNKIVVALRDFSPANIEKIKVKIDSPAIEFTKLEHEWQEIEK